jgi:hypothetical protein
MCGDDFLGYIFGHFSAPYLRSSSKTIKGGGSEKWRSPDATDRVVELHTTQLNYNPTGYLLLRGHATPSFARRAATDCLWNFLSANSKRTLSHRIPEPFFITAYPTVRCSQSGIQ